MNTTYPNDILPFGVDASEARGDLLTLDEYLNERQRLIGHQSGIARRELANRQARQTSHMAAGLAQFIANRFEGGVRDDGDLDAVEAGLAEAIQESVLWEELSILWKPTANYRIPKVVLGSDGKLYLWKKASGPAVAGVGAKDPKDPTNNEYWLDYAASITPPIPTPYPIGIPMEWRSTTLGENMVWADRGAVYFADWPEFKALYDNNGFAGMVLPASANVAEQQAQLGKWALLPDSLGLLTPDRRGQFVRGWGHGQTVDVGREAGSWQSDEFKSHSHNYYIGGIYTNAAPGNARTEVTGMTSSTSNTGGSETRAKNIAVPTAIYMGSSASAFPYKAVYYNIATQKDNTI